MKYLQRYLKGTHAVRPTYGFACSVVSYVQSTPSHSWSTVNDVAWKKYALSDLIGPCARRAWGTYQLAVYLIGCGPVQAWQVLRHSGTLCWCDVRIAPVRRDYA